MRTAEEFAKWHGLNNHPTLEDCVTALEEFANQSKWISVKDEVPKEKGYYLAVVDKRIASSRQGVVEIQECYESVF